ncbi:MAG: DNA polymerase III subunit delta [Burkholderiales bacterium]|nr:DNA polymerase III subunit delta [Burkholderiales bacterium]
MRVDSEQLPQHLQRGLKPVYTVYGDEILLALEAADRIRAEARRNGYGEREVLIAEANFNWTQLAGFAGNLSLFAAKRLLELRIPSGKPGGDGSEALQVIAARPPQDVLTLIMLPRLDRQTQTSKWFTALERAGVAVAAEPIERSRLPQWIAGRLSLQTQQADSGTLAFIAERVEGNLLAAHHEVRKLGLLFPPGPLDSEAVKNAVLDVARYDVFKLGEALLEGDAARLVRFLDGLRGEGVSPPLVLWAMSEEIRALAGVMRRVETGQAVVEALRDCRVWGKRQSLMRAALRRIGLNDAEDALLHAAKIDRMIKGLLDGNVWDEFARLALGSFCGAPRTLARA